MKKLIGLILALSLVFSFAADAFAAGRPKITKQPETATTKKGKAVFSITVTGTVDSYTWYFTDPSTDETISGQKLQKSKRFKGLKITGYNGKKMTLSKVPDAMHGWQVYCHVNGNGYKMDSDTVFLYIAGMDVSADNTEPSVKADAVDDLPAEPDGQASSLSDDMPVEPDDDMSGISQDVLPYDPDDDMAVEPEVTVPAETGDSTDISAQESYAPAGEKNGAGTITVTANAKVLRMLDASGSNPVGEPVSILEIESGGSVIVQSIDSIIGWTIGDTRFEPASSIFELRVLNLSQDMVVDIMTPSTPDDMIDTAPEDMIETSPDGHDSAQPDESPDADDDTGFDLSAVDESDMPVPVFDDKDTDMESEDQEMLSASSDVDPESETPEEPAVTQDIPATLPSSSGDVSFCSISCTGCTFTYLSGGLRSVREGQVPAGAKISVIADDDSAAAAGYRINGGSAGHIGVTSFKITVDGDMIITAGR